MSRIAVIGGGISGLTCAHYLAKFGSDKVKEVIVLEASSRLGGWIHSQRTSDGAVFELGPRSIRGFGKLSASTLQLVEELGLTNDVIPVLANHVAAQNRYIYARNRLHILPTKPLALLKRSPLFQESLAWRILGEMFVPAGESDDETIHSFMTRRFGDKIADYLVDPFVRGIFAGDCRDLSMKSCLPDVFNLEKSHGSIVKGSLKTRPVPLPDSDLVRRSREEKWSIWSLRTGLSGLTDSLGASLDARRNARVRAGTPCRALEFNQHGAVVKTDSEEIRVDHVVAATNSKHLSSLLPKESLSNLAAMLNKISYVTVGVVNLEYRGDVMPHKGFGHLIPSFEPSKVLGIVYDSCAFPEQDRPQAATTRLTCMMGGAWFADLFGDADTVSSARLSQTAIDAVREQLGVNDDPIRDFVSVQKDCIPQYRVGHSKLLDDIRSEVDARKLPLYLIGAPYHGVSVNDCIYDGMKTAQRICDHLSGRQSIHVS